MRSAVRAQREGRIAQAIELYQSVLRSHPTFPEAHNNLAVALKAEGRVEEALHSLRNALKARPDYAAAHANLASTLILADRRMEALRHGVAAVRLDPSNGGHKRVLAELLLPLRLSAASPEVVEAIAGCFEAEGIEHQLISAAAVSLLRHDPVVERALRLARSPEPSDLKNALIDGSLGGLFENRLLHRVMTKTVVADPGFESFLGKLRNCCLARLREIEAPPAGLFHQDPSLIIALAMQCFLNGYLYPEPEDPDRTAPPEPLDGQTSLPAVIVRAMFKPLDQASELPEPVRADPRCQDLIRQQVTEPGLEDEIAGSLPALTPVRDPTSQAVRDQYEESPYPRWLSTGFKTPRPLAQVAGDLFPHWTPPSAKTGPAKILIAGCGTGKHAVDVALRYRDAEILAVDLSRASLAYAQRKAQELGLQGIRFAQADILALDRLGERFDLIESVGVLHHLADPLKGWRQLCGLLNEGGLMRIGLYSTQARRGLEAARQYLRDRGFRPGATDLAPEAIKRSRQALLDLPSDHPAAGVARELDFFTLSGCRDLLFNVQERTLSVPEIADWLKALDLVFLGFEFAEEAIAKAYRARFPQDRNLTDLSLWDRFEEERPQTFRTMYQFWCQKA